jgi:hypothetical protein
VITTIFYGHGLGLLGVDRAGQFAIVLGVWAFRLLASSAWRLSPCGPVEWALAIYGRQRFPALAARGRRGPRARSPSTSIEAGSVTVLAPALARLNWITA